MMRAGRDYLAKARRPDAGTVIPEHATVMLYGRRISARQLLNGLLTGATSAVELKRDAHGEIVAVSIPAAK